MSEADGAPHTDRRGRQRVSKAQAVKRRALLSELLASDVDLDAAHLVLADKFADRAPPVTRSWVAKNARRILAGWQDHEAERRPHHRRQAQRRLHRHIAAARAAKNYTAVASLERLLADVQGTREPVEVSVSVDATVRESVVLALGMMSPDRVAALAAAASGRRAQLGDHPALAGAAPEAPAMRRGETPEGAVRVSPRKRRRRRPVLPADADPPPHPAE